MKFFKRLFCEHKWKLIKKEKHPFCYRTGRKILDKYIITFEAFKCKKCGKFKFIYSNDMSEFRGRAKAKKDFEFKIINNINNQMEN